MRNHYENLYDENYFNHTIRYCTHHFWELKRPHFYDIALTTFYNLMRAACKTYGVAVPQFNDEDDFDTIAEKIIDIIGDKEIDLQMLRAINFTCAQTGNVKLAEFVHSRGMDLFATTYRNEILRFAVANSHYELVDFYLQHADLTEIDTMELLQEATTAIDGKMWLLLVYDYRNPKTTRSNINYFELKNNIELFLQFIDFCPPHPYLGNTTDFYADILSSRMLDDKPIIKQKVCNLVCEFGNLECILILIKQGYKLSQKQKDYVIYFYYDYDSWSTLSQRDLIEKEASLYNHYFKKDFVIPESKNLLHIFKCNEFLFR